MVIIPIDADPQQKLTDRRRALSCAQKYTSISDEIYGGLKGFIIWFREELSSKVRRLTFRYLNYWL